jgi:ParB/RepB/Spo0J family partition protein
MNKNRTKTFAKEGGKSKSNVTFEIFLKSDNTKTVVKFQHQILSAETLRDKHFTQVSEFNPRNQEYLSSRSLLELKSDIEEKGQLKPIYVIKTEDGGYEVLDGSRRLNVAVLLGIPLKAFVTEARLTETQKQELTNSLNSGKPHSLIERGELYCKLMERGIYQTQKDIANATAQGKSQVSLAITAYKLPEAIKEAFAEPTTLGRSQINKLNDIKNKATKKLTPVQLTDFYDRLYEEIIPDEFEFEIEKELKKEQEAKLKVSKEDTRIAAVNAEFLSVMRERDGKNYKKISPKLRKANQELYDFLDKQFTHPYITQVNESFRIRLEEEFDVSVGSLISDEVMDEFYEDYQHCLNEIKKKQSDKNDTSVDQTEINVRVTARIQEILDEILEENAKPSKPKAETRAFGQTIRSNATETEKRVLETVFKVEPEPKKVVEGFEKLSEAQLEAVSSLPLGAYVQDLIASMQKDANDLLQSKDAFTEEFVESDAIESSDNIIPLIKHA